MRLYALLVLLILPGVVHSQSNCSSPTTQAEMNHCAALDLAKATDEINATYADLRRRVSAKKREPVKQVQLAWIVFKDRNCRLESSYAEGGSMQPLIRDTCLTRLTEQRNKELRQLRALLVD